MADRGLGPGLLRDRALAGLCIAAAGALVAMVLRVWAARLLYPFDLEWMEGGMLAHAWRLQQGLPLYVEPGPDFVPFVYPPGYAAVVAFVAELPGLSPALGRVVSVGGTLASAAAIAVAVRQRGGAGWLALAAAAVWLGTYPMTGAFFDLVRPDALGVGAMAWAVVLCLRPRPGAAVAAGLLTALAVLLKHNLGLVALPLVAAWIWRQPRHGLRYAAATGLPVLLVSALVQLRSEGRFFAYLLDVPRSHRLVWDRLVTVVPWELANALSTPLVVLAFAMLFGLLRSRGRLPGWLVAGLPVWTGFVVAWGFTYAPAPPVSGTTPLGLAVTVAAVVSMVLMLPLFALGRGTATDPPPLDPALVIAGGVVIVTSFGSMLMRVHDGGYANVEMPMFWSWSLAFGLVLADADRSPARPLTRLALAVSLGVAIHRLPVDALRPTTADVAQGQQLVEGLRDVEGPVLSPFAAWLPTYAGHPPSLHAQAAWDLMYPKGPFVDDVAVFERAIRGRHWGAVVGGNFPLVRGYAFAEVYEPGPLVVGPAEGPLRPKTGFVAMPLRLLRVPSEAPR
ncbi:MAG: glycosyltransferase 87 family protein [Myxococcota bacterium]